MGIWPDHQAAKFDWLGSPKYEEVTLGCWFLHDQLQHNQCEGLCCWWWGTRGSEMYNLSNSPLTQSVRTLECCTHFCCNDLFGKGLGVTGMCCEELGKCVQIVPIARIESTTWCKKHTLQAMIPAGSVISAFAQIQLWICLWRGPPALSKPTERCQKTGSSRLKIALCRKGFGLQIGVGQAGLARDRIADSQCHIARCCQSLPATEGFMSSVSTSRSCWCRWGCPGLPIVSWLDECRGGTLFPQDFMVWVTKGALLQLE